MTTDAQDLCAASGAYVLHALDPETTRRFEDALASSESLRTEVVELADTAVALGLSLTPVVPSRELRDRILAGIAAEPAHLAPRRRPRRAVRIGAAAAGVLALAAATAGILVVGAPAAPAPVPADRVTAVAPVDGGGTLTVRWSHRLGTAQVTARGLPAAGDGRVYELWYIDGVSTRAAGTLDGDGTVTLAGHLDAGDTIGMTIEPASGSAAPTEVPIAAVST